MSILFSLMFLNSSIMYSEEAFLNNVMESVVMINYDGGYGAGFLVEDNILVTAKHVINNSDFFTLFNHSGMVYITEDVYYVDHMDLAFIKVSEEFSRGLGLEFSDSPLLIGDTVYTIGSPFGSDWSVAKGILSNESFDVQGDSYHQFHMPVYDGNSGGPILNERGEIVSICNARIVEGLGYSFGIPLKDIENALDEYKKISSN